jgi:hypothetical protein
VRILRSTRCSLDQRSELSGRLIELDLFPELNFGSNSLFDLCNHLLPVRDLVLELADSLLPLFSFDLDNVLEVNQAEHELLEGLSLLLKLIQLGERFLVSFWLFNELLLRNLGSLLDTLLLLLQLLPLFFSECRSLDDILHILSPFTRVDRELRNHSPPKHFVFRSFKAELDDLIAQATHNPAAVDIDELRRDQS